MSKKFAEKIIDSMVDENGNCGPRGLSNKQFILIAQHLVEHEKELVGSWSGDYGRLLFTSTDYTGRIGKYYVELNVYFHLNPPVARSSASPASMLSLKRTLRGQRRKSLPRSTGTTKSVRGFVTLRWSSLTTVRSATTSGVRLGSTSSQTVSHTSSGSPASGTWRSVRATSSLALSRSWMSTRASSRLSSLVDV